MFTKRDSLTRGRERGRGGEREGGREGGREREREINFMLLITALSFATILYKSVHFWPF